VLAPAFKARMLGLRRVFRKATNILGNRDAKCWTIPKSFKTKEESKLGVLEYILQPDQYPELYGNVFHKVRINYYPPRATTRKAGTNIDSLRMSRLSVQIKSRLPVPRFHPRRAIVLDLALFFDLAQRARLSGIQECCLLYFKTADGPGAVS